MVRAKTRAAAAAQGAHDRPSSLQPLTPVTPITHYYTYYTYTPTRSHLVAVSLYYTASLSGRRRNSYWSQAPAADPTAVEEAAATDAAAPVPPLPAGKTVERANPNPNPNPNPNLTITLTLTLP